MQHRYNSRGICEKCGCSQSAVESYGWSCSGDARKKAHSGSQSLWASIQAFFFGENAGCAEKTPGETSNKEALAPSILSNAAKGKVRLAVKAKEVTEIPKSKHRPSKITMISGEKTEKAVASIPERRGDYVYPPLSLLPEACERGNTYSEDYGGMMQALVRHLSELGINVIPGEVHTGLVLTRYEVTPAPDARVEDVIQLSHQLAERINVSSIKISPLPKSGAGIYVPNKAVEAVLLRDILESRAWAEANAEIALVLGKDGSGKPIVVDLHKLGHLLVTGASGSGKTNFLRALTASLLYHSGPDDLRFLVCDSKILEYQEFNALPHMLIPVVTEPAKVPGMLKWLIAEMEHRYQIFAKSSVRNIAGFNAKIDKDKAEQAKAEAMFVDMSAEERDALQQMEVPCDDGAFEIPRKKLPYIICLIDDLADFYFHAKSDVEATCEHLLRLSAVAGIHLIVSIDSMGESELSEPIRHKLQAKLKMTHVPYAPSSATNCKGGFRFNPHGHAPMATSGAEPGHIYIMRNTSLPENCYKIGLTRESPHKRASELSSATGVPTEFEVVYSQETGDCRASEAAIHRDLADCRVSKNREFFNCPLEQAISVVSRHCAITSDDISIEGVSPFISVDEFSSIIYFLKDMNNPPEFSQAVQRQIDAGGDDDGADDECLSHGDELLPDAIDVLRSTKRASTSMLQRRLRIGYNHAARLMSELEERGIVGPENGSSPREIMVDLDAM